MSDMYVLEGNGVSGGTHRGHKRVSNPLELELQAVLWAS